MVLRQEKWEDEEKEKLKMRRAKVKCNDCLNGIGINLIIYLYFAQIFSFFF